jgi:D-lactate dehydrogenase (cytochrome)
MSGMASFINSRINNDFSSVPVSRLPELVHETKQDLLESNLRSTIVGHVGDGNFHALILFCIVEIYQIFLLILGTGEHGVGVGKKEYLVEELGVNTVELMRTIKRAIDPLNIMNPGKVSRRFKTFITLVEIAQALSR